MSYPKITSDNFEKDVTKIFKKYKISDKQDTFENICFPKKYKTQLPQQFVSEYIGPKTNYKSLLIFWQIGSGKTCGAVRIAESWKGKRNIHVVLPASLKGNFRKELRTQCAENNYLTEKERTTLKKLNPTDKEYKSIINKSDERINKYYKIYSHNKFLSYAEKNKINLSNSVLIIDEIQNIISDDGKYYKIIKKTIDNSPSDLRIILMTATPMFDKPSEIALIINLLKPQKELPTGSDFDKMFINIKKKENDKISYELKNIDEFKKMIKGYISYFKGAPSFTFPKKNLNYVKCEMSDFQYRSYLTVLKSEPNENYKFFTHGNISKLPNNFFIGTRMISNIAYPNYNTKEKGFESFNEKATTTDLCKYSTKFCKILKKIKQSTGTIFVYSNFKGYGGIKSFIHVLENNGYKNFSNHGIGHNRFAVWSGDEKQDYRESIREIFNLLNNQDGSKIKIICGSPAIKEGVSFQNVEQVHILEPTWNIARLEQIIGRAVRYCSHKHLTKQNRYVDVFIYLATHSNEKETVDEYILNLSLQKYKLVNKFEELLKESAIDHDLFNNN